MSQLILSYTYYKMCIFEYFAYLRLVIFPTFHNDRLAELIDKKKVKIILITQEYCTLAVCKYIYYNHDFDVDLISIDLIAFSYDRYIISPTIYANLYPV